LLNLIIKLIHKSEIESKLIHKSSSSAPRKHSFVLHLQWSSDYFSTTTSPNDFQVCKPIIFFSKKVKSSTFLINGLKNNKNTNPYKLPASEMTRNPTSNPTSFLYVVFLLYCLLRKEMRMGEFRVVRFFTQRERERESYGCWCLGFCLYSGVGKMMWMAG
jgi:hypothetical protein